MTRRYHVHFPKDGALPLAPIRRDVGVEGTQCVEGQGKLAGRERPSVLFTVKHLLELSPEETSVVQVLELVKEGEGTSITGTGEELVVWV